MSSWEQFVLGSFRLCLLFVVLPIVAYLGFEASGLLYRMSPKDVAGLAAGRGGARVSRKVVLIVVDGLSVGASKGMPHLVKLANKGATLIAQTEPFSYSRVGYTALGTGAHAWLTGVTTNNRRYLRPVDSVFHRAGKAGLLAGFVGYAWWMGQFAEVLPLASFGAGKVHKHIPLVHKHADYRRPQAIPKGHKYRVLRSGKYVSVTKPWRRAILVDADAFGDNPATPAHEDTLRTTEALRLLKRETKGWMVPTRPVDLLVLHLQAPDQAGHKTGTPHSKAYRNACEVVDQEILRVASALDLSKDTLIVTADHGFSSATVGTGHGGWEASATQVPLVLVGKGIQPGYLAAKKYMAAPRRDALELVQHVDVAPTISVLLGLSFPKINQGVPAWKALALPGLLEAHRMRQLQAGQIRLYRRLMKGFGWQAPGLDEHPTLAGRADAKVAALWQATRRAFEVNKAWHQRLDTASNLSIGMFVLLLWLLLWWKIGTRFWVPGLWWGALGWLGHQALFLLGYLFIFGPLSLSSLRLSPGYLLTLMAWYAGSLVFFVLVGCAGLWWSGVGRRFWRFSGAMQGFGLCVLAAVVIGFGVTGWGARHFLPHGLSLFAAFCAYGQAAMWVGCAMLSGVWWVWHEGARGESVS